ncbi:ferritin-like domain-containing protein [Nocardia seriolae]|uniref:Iminophenyl-pyruvate dimer synthase domain-containing protein n=1 Tax=Nocardia seriolae TaxID=37332 RepID=A0A0B8NQ20_9NOCA|nr:ferritin-like domain-containing protein [Nocardia seriolae]APA96989.1 hypothetical protein NS506_02930 [Nocardia seriolae]MTJ65203.1 hypothetical protein [Nocardia seriolae]MTJ75312.1 hypothetical protein [Nocardia seriolae]MTJ86875.1 hypothetical protein [Nocardia seriolae]MTK30870.1 hypothetical protein [Nocardia seriolae]
MSENVPEVPNLTGQGALARTIAARGGLAAPEAPFVIEHREALIYMLCQAAELEHGIMCQYLFAAFSLKTSAAEGLSADELEKVTRWRKLVSHVATQEMLHLSLVHNLFAPRQRIRRSTPNPRRRCRRIGPGHGRGVRVRVAGRCRIPFHLRCFRGIRLVRGG